MKLKLLLIVILFSGMHAAGFSLTRTLGPIDFMRGSGDTLTVSTRFVSDLRISNSTAEFAYLQSYSQGYPGEIFHGFKRKNRDFYHRDFFLNMDNVERGTYLVHARACYQLWEMFIRIR